MKDSWRYLTSITVLVLALNGEALSSDVAPGTKLEISLVVQNLELGSSMSVAMGEDGLVEHSGHVLGAFPELAERVPPARRRQLISLLKGWGFFEMRGNYGCGPEMPYRRIDATLDGRWKAVKFCLGGSITAKEAEALLRVWWGAAAAMSKSGKAEPWESDRPWMGVQ